MTPRPCGGWYHIPQEVECDFDPRMVLHALGCRLGRPCKKFESYKHFRLPSGWVLQPRQDGFVIFDGQRRARIDFTQPDEGPGALTPLAYHRLIGNWCRGPFDLAVVECDLVTPEGDRVYHAFRLVPRTLVVRGGAFAVMIDMSRDIKGAMPGLASPFAFWN